jgi:hypothetical protein
MQSVRTFVLFTQTNLEISSTLFLRAGVLYGDSGVDAVLCRRGLRLLGSDWITLGKI